MSIFSIFVIGLAIILCLFALCDMVISIFEDFKGDKNE